MFNLTLTPTLMKALKTFAIILFLGSSSQTPDALAQVDVYRGVDANNSGAAKLPPSAFNFNPEMSTFDTTDSAPVAKDCLYRFTIVGVPHDPAVVGDTGAVIGLPGFVVTFDDNPPHHWSFSHPLNIDAGEARMAISAFAQENRAGNIVNGTRDDCH